MFMVTPVIKGWGTISGSRMPVRRGLDTAGGHRGNIDDKSCERGGKCLKMSKSCLFLFNLSETGKRAGRYSNGPPGRVLFLLQ
ncbi:hypothetical protein D3C71_2017460 [compost metagenome]